MIPNNSALIYIPKPNPMASVRLVCFSYAGGSSATYLPWQKYLDPKIELAVIQLPGRGIRLTEKSYQSMNEIVKHIFLALEKLKYKPFVFFGHSMGARVAYEVILMLHRFGCRLPVHLIASGSRAPHLSRTKEPIYHLPDDEFIAEISALNGSPERVLGNREMMQLLLPVLRADFKIIETYCSKSQLVIPSTISIFAGQEDDIERSEIDAWFTLFKVDKGINWIPGGHFFVDTNRDTTLEVLTEILREYIELQEIRTS